MVAILILTYYIFLTLSRILIAYKMNYAITAQIPKITPARKTTSNDISSKFSAVQSSDNVHFMQL